MSWLSKLFGIGKNPNTNSASLLTPQPSKSKSAHIAWRPDSFPTKIVGESHYQATLSAVCGGHTRHGHELECSAEISLEPTNPYDGNAVRVSISRKVVGYISKDEAMRLGGAMRELGLTSATCRAKIVGGWRTNQYDEGSFGVRLAIPGFGKIDFGPAGIWTERRATEVKPKSRASATTPQPSSAGPLAGHRIAIMGAPRDGEIAISLAKAGGKIMAGVGQTTTILVVAQERPFDPGVLRSASYEKAEKLLAEASNIQIMSLSEAYRLAGTATTDDEGPPSRPE